MQRFTLVFSVLFGLSACGGVSLEAPPEPTPAPHPGTPSPVPQAMSLVCPGAPIDRADDVALWYQSDTGVVFVRHDGTSIPVLTEADASQGFPAEADAGGDRIALAARVGSSAPSVIGLFDRRGVKLAERSYAQGFVSAVFVGDDGRAVFSVTQGSSEEGFIWSGGEPTSLGGWLPIGPVENGWVPVRSSYGASPTTGFVHESGAVQVFHAGSDQSWRAGPRLVRIDGASRELWIGSPKGTVKLPLGTFGAADADAPYIAQVRDEGFVLVARSTSQHADVLVVNVEAESVRHVSAPAASGLDELSFYCNSGWPGYLTSDGSLLTSRIEGGQLRVWRRSPETEQALGKPLAAIAVLGLVERAGTTAIIGSDGSETYCGTPGQIWAEPAPKGALVGDSVQLVRNGAEPQLGTFTGSFDEPSIHQSGACVLDSSFDAGVGSARVRDLGTGAVFSLPSGSGIASFLD